MTGAGSHPLTPCGHHHRVLLSSKGGRSATPCTGGFRRGNLFLL